MPEDLSIIQLKSREELEIYENDLKSIVNELLNDQDKLQWLHLIAKEYAYLIDNIIADAIKLNKFDNVIYLVDFDVLRNYIEQGATSTEQIFVDNFFYETTPKYGIPEGAFTEFLIWLKRLRQFDYELKDKFLYKGENGINALANIFEIETRNDINDEDLLNEISERIDNKAVVLTRLLNVFTDPRFIGLVSNYEPNDAKQLKEILSLLPRKKSRGDPRRHYLDDNDGINMAIAIKSYRESKKADGREENKPVYYLVTQTNIILKLIERLRELINENAINPDVLSTLEYLMGENQNLDDLPVMHPRQVVNAEHLGAYSDIERPVEQLRTWRKVFNDFKERVEDNLLPQNFQQYGRKSRPKLEIADTTNFLESLTASGQVFFSEIPNLYSVEELRAKSISVDFARRQQISSHVSLQDKITQKTIGLVRLLDQVQALIDETHTIQYDMFLEDVQRVNFTKFSIKQITGAFTGNNIIEGEIFYSQEDNESKAPHFEIRWPIYCDNETFTNALKNIIYSSAQYEDNKVSTHRVKLEHLENEIADYWNQGLIVYCLGEVFASSLDFLTTGQNWRQLTLRNLKQQVEVMQKNKKVFGELDNLSTIEIQQYRVNTKVADFVYDVIPIEPQRVRYLTVMSHYNISEHIISLFDRTGFVYCATKELNKIIRKLLSRNFPQVDTK